MKQLDTKFMHPSEQLAVIIGRIYRSEMTTTSGGNLSIKDENDDIWITPSAVDKGNLRPDDIMCVKPDGQIIGKHKPSSEFPFHKAIYEMRPEMTAVIHAHPPGLVAFSIVHQVPDTNIIPQARAVCGKIGFAPYDVPGSLALGEKIAEEFRKNPDYKAVIMENHGVVLCGTDMMDAYERFETLEFCARTIINSRTLGQPTYLSEEQISAYEKCKPANLPRFMDVSHPSDERAIRSEIVQIVRRSCDQGLMISSYGTVSVRWRGDDFLITPRDIARWDIEPKQIVQVKGGMIEAGKVPSRSVAMHQRIYQMNPHINSIIMTQSPHLMAFATSGTKYDVHTIPERWIFLQDIPTVDYGIRYSDQNPIPELVGKYPAVMMANDGMIVTGDKLLNTFDKLEVAEFSAKSLIMAAPIGTLKPIDEAQIEDLRIAFNVK
ncbi:MAG: class II aldolase/adducin family protein [Rikenellaceae bacterium]|nr:class II aldolase/adducin family protein [Rikenellaceae bacterium]